MYYLGNDSGDDFDAGADLKQTEANREPAAHPRYGAENVFGQRKNPRVHLLGAPVFRLHGFVHDSVNTPLKRFRVPMQT